jgi:hypothetical protein
MQLKEAAESKEGEVRECVDAVDYFRDVFLIIQICEFETELLPLASTFQKTWRRDGWEGTSGNPQRSTKRKKRFILSE